VIAFDHVENVLSVMSTCGMYDYAGSWLYRVGMPAKSGVAGGVIAVLPGQFGIGVYSPPLDAFGNSVRGVAVCEALSEDFGLHLLRPPIHPGAVVMQMHTLAQSGSKRRRRAEEMRTIAEHGNAVCVLRLQGPLAFSTAEVALRRAAEAYEPGGTIVFDCARTASMDAAAARLFQAFNNVVASLGGHVIIAGLPDSDGPQALAAPEGGAGPMLFANIDSALEWCEDRLLHGSGATWDEPQELRLADHPMLTSLTEGELRVLSERLTRTSYEPRDVIVRQGEAADAVYFVTAGVASVQLNLPGERRHRLATLGQGATFGEVALLDSEPRTADVEADSELICYVLSTADLAAVDDAAPGVRLKLMEALARDLAARLRRADREIMTLAS
jgi:glutaminase